MSRSALGRLVMAASVLGVLGAGAPHSNLRAQAPATAANVARDPDVLGAQRLFSAWLEGQIVTRHLPGIAVGVVADQKLVWATGFGFADTGQKVAMTPQTPGLASPAPLLRIPR